MADSHYVMQDPREQYMGPPSESDILSAPGARRGTGEKPDCGEISHTGAGRVAGRKALLTGGDSGIGRAAATAFAPEGADMAIKHLPEAGDNGHAHSVERPAS